LRERVTKLEECDPEVVMRGENDMRVVIEILRT